MIIEPGTTLVLPLGNGRILIGGAATILAWRGLELLVKQARRDGLAAPTGMALAEALRTEAQAVAVAADVRRQVPVPRCTEETITVAEAARLLGISHRQVRRIAPRLGRKIRRQWALDAMLVAAEQKERNAT